MWKKFWDLPVVKDIAERSVRTFIQTFLAQLTTSGMGVAVVTDLSLLGKASTAAVAAVISMVMGLLATRYGNPQSASVLDKDGE